MARIAVISKHFGYNVGGAERSMIEMMRAIEKEGNEIYAYVNASPKHFGASDRPFELPSTWVLRTFSLPVDWTRFRFLECFLNARAVGSLVDSMNDIDVLYAYGHFAPMILNRFPRKKVYLARDEYALGWNCNYYKGVRYLLQQAYFVAEYPFRCIWMRALVQAVRSSDLVANSSFIASGFGRIVPGKAVRIVPPQVDVDGLCAEYYRAGFVNIHEKGVVAVGDNILKGGDIFRRVAAAMPDLRFYLFDRKYEVQIDEGNLSLMPWQHFSGSIYRFASIVMVPSRVNEAFGRVAMEAKVLGIRVVASNRGGIPEVIRDPSMLVDDIDDVSQWTRRIRFALADVAVSTKGLCFEAINSESVLES